MVEVLTAAGDDVALANADGMLRKIMAAADTNKDGRISYEGGCFSALLAGPGPRHGSTLSLTRRRIPDVHGPHGGASPLPLPVCRYER